VEIHILFSVDLNYVNKENLRVRKDEAGEVERMFKELVKSLENKPLDP